MKGKIPVYAIFEMPFSVTTTRTCMTEQKKSYIKVHFCTTIVFFHILLIIGKRDTICKYIYSSRTLLSISNLFF